VRAACEGLPSSPRLSGGDEGTNELLANRLEFLRIFRKDPPLASIPVLIVTAMPEAARRELVAGVLAKPFNFDRLLATIEQVCTGSRLKLAAGT
jgi:CheY-like chemotaxis protein